MSFRSLTRSALIALLALAWMGQAHAKPKSKIHPMAKFFSSDNVLSGLAPNMFEALSHIKQGANNHPNFGKDWARNLSRMAQRIKRTFQLKDTPTTELEIAKALGLKPKGAIAGQFVYNGKTDEPEPIIAIEYSNEKAASNTLRKMVGRNFARTHWYNCVRRMSGYAKKLKKKGVDGPYTMKVIEKTYPKFSSQCPHLSACEYYDRKYRNRSFLRARCQSQKGKSTSVYSYFYELWQQLGKAKLPSQKLKGGTLYGGPKQMFSYATVDGRYMLISSNDAHLRDAIRSYRRGGSRISRHFRMTNDKTLLYAYLNNKKLAVFFAKSLRKAMGATNKWVRRYRTRQIRTMQLLNNTFAGMKGRLWAEGSTYRAKVVATKTSNGTLSAFFTKKLGHPAKEFFRFVPANAVFAIAQNMSRPLADAFSRFLIIQEGSKEMGFTKQTVSIVNKHAALFLLPSKTRRSFAMGGVIQVKSQKAANAFLERFQKKGRFKYQEITYRKQTITFIRSPGQRTHEFAYAFLGNNLLFTLNRRMKPNAVIKQLIDLALRKGKGSLASRLISARKQKQNAYFHMSFKNLRQMLSNQMGRRIKYRSNQDMLGFFNLFKTLQVSWKNKRGQIHLKGTLKLNYKR